jgi:glucosyl-3-phosphoglycerate synthase
MTEPMTVCALLPAYNEAERIAVTIGALRARPEIGQIVVLDDGSTDGTADRARAAGASLVLTQQNGGKGAALSAAYAAARDRADVFLLLDADLGASAGEAVKLLPPLARGAADMTVGMLPPDPGFAASGQSGGRGFVVRLARWGIRRRTGQTFTQPLSGQRAVRREVLEALGGTFAPGFGVEVDLTVRAIRAGFRVLEVQTDFRHKVTGADWEGLSHRARQFRDVARIVLAPMTT